MLRTLAVCLALTAVCLAQNDAAVTPSPSEPTVPPTVGGTKADTIPPTSSPTKKKTTATDAPTPSHTEAPTTDSPTPNPATSAPTKIEKEPAPATPPAIKPVVKPTLIKPVNGSHFPRIPIDNMTHCECAGVSDPAGRGGASCDSLDPRNGRAFCFTKKGACADSNPILKKVNVFKEGYDLSFDACKCANEEKKPGIGACKCAGVQDARGMGRSTCNSSISSKEPQWCYTKQGACCDGRPSEEPGMKKFDYSNDACACKTDRRKCRCTRAGFDNAWRSKVNPGHGMCNSVMSETPGAAPKHWCYTYPGSCCDGMPKKVGPFVYHISFEACEHNNPRAGFVRRNPAPPPSSSGHTWIFGVVIFIVAMGGLAGYVVYRKRSSFAGGARGATPGASGGPSPARSRHAPPPSTYGPLSSTRVRIEWPDNAKLHGAMMWTSTFNEATDTYICKTHEPGPSGVKPYCIKADKLVAEVE